MRLLAMIREALRSLFPQSESFRTETIVLDRFPTPIKTYEVWSRSGRDILRTGHAEAVDAWSLVRSLHASGSVQHMAIVEVDGLRFRLRRDADPTLIDPAARSHTGDRARWRKERG